MLGRFNKAFGIARGWATASAQGTPTPPAVMPFPTVSTAPTVRLHTEQSTLATASGRITSMSDVANPSNPPATGTSTEGPLLLADDNGWPVARFNGFEWLSGGWSGSSGVTFDVRNTTVLLVCRVHRSRARPLFSIGSVAAGTGQNTGNALVRTVSSGLSAGYLGSQGAGIPGYASNRTYMIPGAELQVIAVRSSTTNLRLYVQDKTTTAGANSNITAGVQGYEIGRNAANNSPGTAGTWGEIDLYDALVYNSALSDAALDQIVGELMTGYGIQPTIGRVIMAGDSITFGLTAPSGENPAMWITRPGGSAQVPPGYNVIGVGVSGWAVSNLVTQRDDANTVFNELIPGGDNIVSVHIGTNNIDGGETAQQTYDALVPLLNTTTTGYLQRGWRVFVDRIIAYRNTTFQTQIEGYRALVSAPQFLTDTLSGPSQTFDGRVGVVNVSGFTFNGQTVFDTFANAQNINGAGPPPGEGAPDGSNLLVYTGPPSDVAHLRPLGNRFLAQAKRDGIAFASGAPTLNALSLTGTAVQNVSSTINIVGATAGSTISVQSGSLPPGMTLNSAARTISGTPPTIAKDNFTLRETLTGATNTPNDTALSIEVVAAPAGVTYVGATTAALANSTTITANVPAGAQAGDILVAWIISGANFNALELSGWTRRYGDPATENFGFSVQTLASWDGTTSSYTFTLADLSPVSIILMAYRGAAFDAISALTSAVQDPTPPTMTVVANNCVNLTLAGGIGAGREYTMPSGWTQRLFTTTNRSSAAFQRDATVNSGSLAGVQVTRSVGTGNSRALQMTLRPL
jgi:hypothetical protein